MTTDIPFQSEDPVFGLSARFKSGLDRNVVDTIFVDEVLRLIQVAASPAGSHHIGGVSRLMHFGFLDGNGHITKAGQAFLRKNAMAILTVLTKAVLQDDPIVPAEAGKA